MSQTYNKNIYSIKLSDSKHQEVSVFLSKQNLPSSLIPYGISYKFGNCLINLYDTKKILIQGSNVINVVSKLPLPFIKYQKEESIIEQHNQYIGCDEVGVGDYFGGIVCCAVYTDEQISQKLKQLGVDDSKKLSDQTMFIMFDKIKNICKYKITVISPHEYNSLFDKFQNSHVIKTYGHNKCVSGLKKDVGNKFVIMDKFCDGRLYNKYSQISGMTEKIDLFVTKAESKYIGVAAASVLARCSFLEMINQLQHILIDKYNLNISKVPLGASSSLVLETISKIGNKLGNDVLSEFIKMHFKR